MRKLIIALVAFSMIAVGGCNEKGEKTPDVLKPAALLIDPIVKQYSDPDKPMAGYSKFSVLPRSVAVDSSAQPAFGHELLEKQMLFALRSSIECRGYKFVPDPSDSDFILTIDGSNDYKSHDIPPSSVTMPSYVPSRVITSSSRESGHASAYGTYGSAYGTYSGTEQTTTRVPGYWTTRTYDTPGRTVGNYYPLVAVTVFDTETGRSVWYGSAVSCSDNPDVRVSSQLLIQQLLGKMPPSDKAEDNNPPGAGMLGVRFVPFTPDGDTMYPLVVGTMKDSPAARAGLKLGDLILAIDGAAVANKPFSEVWKLVSGEPGTACVLEIARGKKVSEVRLERAPRRLD